MFEKIRTEVREDAEQGFENVKFYICNGYRLTWANSNRNNPDRGLREHSTPRRWEQYQAGEITREKAVAYATSRILKKIEKNTADKFAWLDRVSAAPDLSYITISVDWVRSRTWGYNPHVEVRTNTGVFTGTASGCGYDKESAAIAEALNKCDSVLKALYTLKEAGLRAGISDKSEDAPYLKANYKICGYGSGHTPIPYFEGGVGVSSFWEIFKKCGFSVSCHHSKHSDFYNIEKEE